MKNLRKIIKEVLEEMPDSIFEFGIEEDIYDEGVIDEERITNKDASEKVNNKENFIGSHTYGEDIGGLGKLYVAYSYGTWHPLYVWDGENDRWYHNYEDFMDEGKPNIWTRKHLNDLRPHVETQGRPTYFLTKLIRNFKKKNKIGDNTHTDLEPGEK